MENLPKHKLTEWLDKMQQDSWQLELVVSAFAIFLMLGAMNALEDAEARLDVIIDGMDHNGQILSLGYGILSGACFFFLINLILHVILRAVWISAIGLRSVSGDIDYEALRLTDRFQRFLQRRIGSFDSYIERLENLCSIVFACTFLIVFMLLAVGLWVILLGLVANTLSEILPEAFAEPVVLAVVFVFAISGALYLLDFVTLGWLKRKRWFAPIYMPIYRIYSVLTLAPLYRPIYYNLIDNKFGRRAGYMLVPYMVAVLALAGIKTNTYVWFPEVEGSQELKTTYYDDLRKTGTVIESSSIPSRFVTNGFLEVFIRYIPNKDDQALEMLCPDFRPLKEPGFTLLEITDKGREDILGDSSLLCLSGLYRLKVDDSLFQNPAFRFYQHPNQGEKGLLATIDMLDIPRGEHFISIEKLLKTKESGKVTLKMKTFAEYSFWKE